MSPLPALRRPTILVADDSPQNIELLSRVLGQDYRIKVATSGDKALKIVYSDEPPDLVLLDIMMPDLSGHEVCRRMKANPDRRRIPVIFVTAMSTIEDEALGLSLGAVDYITKPISPPLVQARVRTHLALYDQSRELERMVGRVRFLWLLVWIAVVPGAVGTALDLYQAGIRPIELAVFVVFCLELPQVRFFGAIPAWGFALAIVGVEVLQLVGVRNGDGIVLLAVSLATALLVARTFGLLTNYTFIPNLRPARSTRSNPERRPRARKGGQRVVAGPWQGSTPAHSADEQHELDSLLDKINAQGLDALSRDEKARLNELSKKLRGR